LLYTGFKFCEVEVVGLNVYTFVFINGTVVGCYAEEVNWRGVVVEIGTFLNASDEIDRPDTYPVSYYPGGCIIYEDYVANFLFGIKGVA
jgi:hypothetical protein